MTATSKLKYECAYCGERFAKMGDHMSHVLTGHDAGQQSRSSRLRRPISCWACGTRDVYPSGSDNWFYCDCGWELPRNWVNGQLRIEQDQSNNEEKKKNDNDNAEESADRDCRSA